MIFRQINCNLLPLLILIGLSLVRTGMAQTPAVEPGPDTPVPIVSFDFVHQSMDPSHYAIAVQSTGPAAYESEPLTRLGERPGDPYMVKFTMSPSMCQKIFELAKQTNFFNGNFDYTKTRIANSGTKTLTYMEGHFPPDLAHPVKGKLNQTTYNWSENPAIQELTRIFQGISTTLEFGQRLDFKRRFDKLGLDAELKRMEEMQKHGDLEEVQAVAPTLKSIANDVSVMHIARQRAQEILSAAPAR